MMSLSEYANESNNHHIQSEDTELFKKAFLDDAFEESIDFEELMKNIGTAQPSYDVQCMETSKPEFKDSFDVVKSQLIISEVFEGQLEMNSRENQASCNKLSLDATHVDLDQFIMNVMCSSPPTPPTPPTTTYQQSTSTASTLITYNTTELPTPAHYTHCATSPSISPYSSSPSSPCIPTKSKDKPTKATTNIPRHLRESHIRAERKRQCKIKGAREQLKNLLGLPRASESKIVEKAVERCQSLKAELVRLDKESSRLKTEKETLDADIDTFIRHLPPTLGEDTLTCRGTLTSLFENHAAIRNHKSSKFSIFESIMHPLFESYVNHVETANTTEEFQHGVQSWCKQNLSLINLRHKITFGLLDWQKSSNLVIHSPVVKASTKRQS